MKIYEVNKKDLVIFYCLGFTSYSNYKSSIFLNKDTIPMYKAIINKKYATRISFRVL